MKTLVLYRKTEGDHRGWTSICRESPTDEELRIEYDETAPCWSCGLPVVEASMGGTVLCPWCDCGNHRDGTELTLQETLEAGERWRLNEHRAKLGVGPISVPLWPERR